jgi:predicted membrane channel-forming protein YqfA (hemolysin III family)
MPLEGSSALATAKITPLTTVVYVLMEWYHVMVLHTLWFVDESNLFDCIYANFIYFERQSFDGIEV